MAFLLTDVLTFYFPKANLVYHIAMDWILSTSFFFFNNSLKKKKE